MSTAFDVRALDATIRIEIEDAVDPRERERIQAQWSDLIGDEALRPDFTIRAGVGEGRLPTASADHVDLFVHSAELLADQITSQITFSAATRLRGHAIMLHAAGIATDDGRVIGLVGPSGRGKTTASRALGATFGYVTDETLAVRLDGTVVAYPKPLSIGTRPGPKRPEAASALGLRSASPELRLAALVLLDRRPEVAAPYIESVPLVEAIAELVQHSSYLLELDHPLLALTETVLATGGVRRVVYAEAETLPPLVEQLLTPLDDGRPQLTDVVVGSERDCDCFMDLIPGKPVKSEIPYLDVPAGTYRRTVHDDALLIDDSLLVLADHRITVVEGVGPTLWLAANDSTEGELREAALRRLPTPPPGVDPAAAVAATLQQLVDAGLLIRR